MNDMTNDTIRVRQDAIYWIHTTNQVRPDAKGNDMYKSMVITRERPNYKVSIGNKIYTVMEGSPTHGRLCHIATHHTGYFVHVRDGICSIVRR